MTERKDCGQSSESKGSADASQNPRYTPKTTATVIESARSQIIFTRKKDPLPDGCVYSLEEFAEIYEILKSSNHYEVLGLDKPGVTLQEIDMAYERIVRLLLYPSESKAPGLAQAFDKINEAMDILSNKDLRKEYDKSLLQLLPQTKSEEHVGIQCEFCSVFDDQAVVLLVMDEIWDAIQLEHVAEASALTQQLQTFTISSQLEPTVCLLLQVLEDLRSGKVSVEPKPKPKRAFARPKTCSIDSPLQVKSPSEGPLVVAATPPPAPDSEDSSSSQERKVQELIAHIMSANDYYEMLDLPRGASEAEVKAAYHRLALLLHPDKNPSPDALEAFKRVLKAVSTLKDPRLRQRYNESIGYRPQHNKPGTNWLQLICAMVVSVFLMISILLIASIPPPTYRLQSSSAYSNRRLTRDNSIPYYVRDDFRFDADHYLKYLEAKIERDFVAAMRIGCEEEKIRIATLEANAKSTISPQQMTPSCDNLAKLKMLSVKV